MLDKLSFQDLQNTCQVLDEFAMARSKAQPDKDLILIIKKINGHETLQTTRLSQMKCYERLIRWFGFGKATLTAVASFLQRNEPHLPKSYSRLQWKDILSFNFTDETVNQLARINKDEYIKLKNQKIRGCEVFKRCLSHHNISHRRKVYILLQEEEKISLCGHGNSLHGSYVYSWPNPLGILDEDKESTISEHYHPPIIDKDEFPYLMPFFKDRERDTLPYILGFCQEYGLGTKKNLEKAKQNYAKGVEAGEYSACYNLGRLYLREGQRQKAIECLQKGEGILRGKIEATRQHLERVQVPQYVAMGEFLEHPIRQETPEEYERRGRLIQEVKKDVDHYCKKWEKALLKIQEVLQDAI